MKVAVLPCNGLDKALGGLAREVALRCAEATDSEIICPVLLNNAPARYRKTLDTLPLVVIDGCPKACAEKNVQMAGGTVDRAVREVWHGEVQRAGERGPGGHRHSEGRCRGDAGRRAGPG